VGANSSFTRDSLAAVSPPRLRPGLRLKQGSLSTPQGDSLRKSSCFARIDRFDGMGIGTAQAVSSRRAQ